MGSKEVGTNYAMGYLSAMKEGNKNSEKVGMIVDDAIRMLTKPETPEDAAPPFANLTDGAMQSYLDYAKDVFKEDFVAEERGRGFEHAIRFALGRQNT